MKIRLIHGIHAKEGNNNMAAFAGHIQQAMPASHVQLFSYGFMGFWQARWRNAGVAKKFAQLHTEERTKEFEVWITHSNGAAIAYQAVEKYDAQPDMIININPALDRWRAARVLRVEVIHSEQDRWVDLSQWLPGHLWGDQGKVGYQGPALNTWNHNASKVSGAMAYKGHCGAFEPSRVNSWAYFCANRIDETLQQFKFLKG